MPARQDSGGRQGELPARSGRRPPPTRPRGRLRRSRPRPVRTRLADFRRSRSRRGPSNGPRLREKAGHAHGVEVEHLGTGQLPVAQLVQRENRAVESIAGRADAASSPDLRYTSPGRTPQYAPISSPAPGCPISSYRTIAAGSRTTASRGDQHGPTGGHGRVPRRGRGHLHARAAGDPGARHREADGARLRAWRLLHAIVELSIG
jgi:hypothetical protein